MGRRGTLDYLKLAKQYLNFILFSKLADESQEDEVGKEDYPGKDMIWKFLGTCTISRHCI